MGLGDPVQRFLAADSTATPEAALFSGVPRPLGGHCPFESFLSFHDDERSDVHVLVSFLPLVELPGPAFPFIFTILSSLALQRPHFFTSRETVRAWR
jgi:hypothetical protein